MSPISPPRRSPRHRVAAPLLALALACTAGAGESESDAESDTAATPCGDGVVDAGEECDDGNTDEGDGCSAVCARAWRRVFISSSVHTGELGGVVGADAICQGLADAAGLGGTYMAWISDASVSPSDRFARATVPYVLVTASAADPQIIATNWDDLVDGMLMTRINIDERGMLAFVPTDTWTNTAPDGGKSSESINCVGWVSGKGASGAVGDGDQLGGAWTKNTSTACSMELRVYCFEQ